MISDAEMEWNRVVSNWMVAEVEEVSPEKEAEHSAVEVRLATEPQLAADTAANILWCVELDEEPGPRAAAWLTAYVLRGGHVTTTECELVEDVEVTAAAMEVMS